MKRIFDKIKEFFQGVGNTFKTNRDSILLFGKVFCLFVAALIAIITNVEIWNMYAEGNTDKFHLVISILNFAMELGLGYFFARKVFFKEEKEKQLLTEVPVKKSSKRV